MPSRRFFFLASYGMLCAAPSTVSGQSPALAITHVDFVDVQSGAVMRDRTVVIAGNRIRSVSSAAAAKLRGKVRLIDARGKFLIPGLWDMHVHVRTSASVYFPELVAWGVTGFRETWGNLDSANLWRKKAQAGAISPRFFVAGNLLDGSPVIWPGSDVVDSPARAIEIVDSLHRAGSPFIKVYSQLSREVYYAIAAEAKRLHMPFIGHVPISLSTAEVSEAGQKSIEHTDGLMVGCTNREAELLDAARGRLRAIQLRDTAFPDRATVLRMRALIRDSFDPETCGRLLDRLARNGTWFTPTLTLYLGRVSPITRADARLAYVPPPVQKEWLSLKVPPDALEFRHLVFERSKVIVAMAQKHGVSILAGTDFSNPFTYAGSGLHDELKLLVEAGLTPLQALRAATLSPARFFEMSDSLGTIERGKIADMVLLDANPLVDIGNTRRIAAVFLNGKYLDRVRLDALLGEAREAVISAARDTVH